MISVTMDDIKAMTDDFITPAAAASVMKMDTGRLIGYAREGQLPFPVQISGNRVKIGRIGFLRAFGIQVEEKERKSEIAEKLDLVIDEMQELRRTIKMLVPHERLIAAAIVDEMIREGGDSE